MTVQEYIKADRQWPRHLRVAHAKLQLARASYLTDPTEAVKFWNGVLEANGTPLEQPKWYHVN